jgi:hypothetical protein
MFCAAGQGIFARAKILGARRASSWYASGIELPRAVCRTQKDVDSTFCLFLERILPGGVLIACGDDKGCKRVVKQAAQEAGMVSWQHFCSMAASEKHKARVILFYGYERGNDVTLHVPSGSMDEVHQQALCGKGSWHVSTRMVWAMPEIRDERQFVGHLAYSLQLLGQHNALNAAGAVLAAAITNAMSKLSLPCPTAALSTGAKHYHCLPC